MGRWAAARWERGQTLMFPPTLEEVIGEDHPVRLFAEILARRDWQAWESQYVLAVGQPPIHPRVVAGAILYGLSLGIRSSRRLEWACKNSLDFIWLVEGRTIDHATFCQFRTRFGAELKGLFRQLCQTAMALGLIRLNQVALDGTRVGANSSRHETRSAADLEQRLAALDEQIARMLSEAQAADQQENQLWGEAVSPNHLPRALANLRQRQEKLAQALGAAQRRQAEQPAAARAPKVPVADPEATIQPNKNGGFAPNYTPMATVDGQRGFIVDADVLADHSEATVTVATVQHLQETLGQAPGQLLADTAHATGDNLEQLAAAGVEAYIPLNLRADGPDNPAHRPDPAAPVAQADWPRLPRNPQNGKLDRAAFVFAADTDSYYCPLGQRLSFNHCQNKHRPRGGGLYRVYQGTACPTCPLRAECLAGRSPYRTVFREEYEELREAMDRRMQSPEGQKIYRRRKWIAETPFAFIKSWMHLRQFLLRGLAKVKTEWLWACTAYNLSKLARALGALRRELAVLLA